MPLIEVRDAAFSYGAQTIFNNITFSVTPGEIFCLLGPNGCGKTTLLDCILGFHRLHSGSILIGDRDTRSYKPGKIARHLAYVPQIHERAFPYTVREIVLMGRAAYLGMFKAPSREDGRLVDEALERIGILHLGDRPYIYLSGGETQLVMIARALVQETPVVIMDEPTAHLDFRYELVIMEVIMDLVEAGNLAVIMATHFPNHAFYFQNNGVGATVALLHEGSFLAVGPPENVLDEERLKILYGVNTSVISLNTDGGSMKHIVPLRTTNLKDN
jgi:iron complex transport system ATP-binding protein